MEEEILAQIIQGSFEDSLKFTDNFYAALEELNMAGRLEKEDDIARITSYSTPPTLQVAINGVRYYGILSKSDIIAIIRNVDQPEE